MGRVEIIELVSSIVTVRVCRQHDKAVAFSCIVFINENIVTLESHLIRILRPRKVFKIAFVGVVWPISEIRVITKY